MLINSRTKYNYYRCKECGTRYKVDVNRKYPHCRRLCPGCAAEKVFPDGHEQGIPGSVIRAREAAEKVWYRGVRIRI